MKELIEKVSRSQLSKEEITRAIDDMVLSKSAPEDTKEFLRQLSKRKETPQEISWAVQALRNHAKPLPLTKDFALCDTCGTGGDGKGTINVSTISGLVAACCGVKVAKHGNRAASSQCGSADLISALGINIEAEPANIARSIEEIGFGFCFAQRFHPAMKNVATIRKELGIRTIFNLIGPLANPAPLSFQLVGVPQQSLINIMAEALKNLGIQHAIVVHGLDGLDEATTTSKTLVSEVVSGAITSYEISPDDFGISFAKLEDIRGQDAGYNAKIAIEVLHGKPSAYLDIVALNSGLAIYAANQAKNMQEGIDKAIVALKSGKAMELLEKVKEYSNK